MDEEIWIVFSTDAWGNVKNLKGFYKKKDAENFFNEIKNSDNIFKYISSKSCRKICIE